ncbi:PhoX domain-containing protein [Fistulina hepatica ATCC 64428]|uniref:PhoX domain-containing protein n=1 Tax=Fistulina hepatica ATCC 64428 TaxID=1128425 RepID=A0A0D7AHU4_9AGAR|nr:PhoX domain-containing protein [Fistulina hepatica ATCC 64428]
MASLTGAQTVVLVAFLSVVLPLVFRVFSSPLLLLVLSPFLVVAVILTGVGACIFSAHLLDSKRQTHKPYLIRGAARPFAFSTPAAWQAVVTRSQWSQSLSPTFPPLIPNSPSISGQINDILSTIVRDFVLSWYQPLSSSPSFPFAVSSMLHDSVVNLEARIERIDWAALLVKRIIPKITAHVDQFRKSEMAIRGAGLERSLTQSEELDLLLAGRYALEGGGKLHVAVENLSTTYTRQSEETHVRELVAKALPYILPERDARSKALFIVVREILSCSVILPALNMFSDPDFCNRFIEQQAGAVIHQQKLINKVRNALELPSPRRHGHFSSSSTPENITIRTDARHFESFLRSINRCSSLLDARRLKNDILGEIRRTRLLLANHENDDWIAGEKTEDVVAFLDRLYTAKRKVEQRIVVLGGQDDSKIPSYQESGPKSGITLREVLHNPNSLSYFMEFMDRRQRSLLVQFWLTVESFKNPLESVDSESEGEDEGDDDVLAMDVSDPGAGANAKEDISMINDLYFSGPAPHPALISISKKFVDSIRDFAHENAAPTPAAMRRVRRSVIMAQRQVERDMEQDFEEFQRSELWYRATGDADFGNRKIDVIAVTKSTSKHSDHGGGDGNASEKLMLQHVTTPIQASHPHHLQRPRVLPRSESTPLNVVAVPMQRSSSSNSTKSVQSLVATAKRPTKTLDELMLSTDSDDEASTRAPLFGDPEDETQREEEERMEAISAALSDILAFDQEHVGKGKTSVDSETNLVPSSARRSSGKSPARLDDVELNEADEQEEAYIPSRSDHRSHPPSVDVTSELQLPYEIHRLSTHIEKLNAQDTMLEALIRRAELTGVRRELKILTTSKQAVNRELAELQFKKSQYEQQASANRLVSDRTRVSIVSSTSGAENGRSVVRYLIEVQQLAPDGTIASGWIVARRYNEFLNMHNKLRERYGLVRALEFPGKRLVAALTPGFVDTRRVALEKYLQSVVAISAVCESDALRTFLSRDSPFVAAEPPAEPSSRLTVAFSGTDLVRNVYNTVATSIDDMIFGPSMLDVIIQRLSQQVGELAGIVGTSVNDEDLIAQALRASGKASTEATLMQLPSDLKTLEGETSSSTFSGPICDLVLAVFELNKDDNWLRRQAVVMILQQVFGSTIERSVRDVVKTYTDEAHILSYIETFRNSMWEDGKLRPPSAPRISEEKTRTRNDAMRKLSAAVPEFAANMIGRTNARRGARRIFAVLQNRRLNQHIIYTIVDEVSRCFLFTVRLVDTHARS